MSKYNRKIFGFNSKKARSMIVLNESFDYHGVKMLLDRYNGSMIEVDRDKWDAEHIFPLSSAWDAGFNQMYRTNPTQAIKLMKEFANDPRNLIPVSASSNRSRGAKTLWNWSPLNLTFIPTRNHVVRALASTYGLKLNTMQLWAMEWADNKILIKYKHGIHLGKSRSWLIQKGFYQFLMPF